MNNKIPYPADKTLDEVAAIMAEIWKCPINFAKHHIEVDGENEKLKSENKILRDALNPHAGVKGLYPLILYFDNRAEADEFTELVQQAKPGMRSYKI